jgi:hypothetical protein
MPMQYTGKRRCGSSWQHNLGSSRSWDQSCHGRWYLLRKRTRPYMSHSWPGKQLTSVSCSARKAHAHDNDETRVNFGLESLKQTCGLYSLAVSELCACMMVESEPSLLGRLAHSRDSPLNQTLSLFQLASLKSFQTEV